MTTKETNFPRYTYPDDVHRVDIPEKTILLIGTAHVSQQSIDLVEKVIEQEDPDHVCIELDVNRYRALSEKKKWQTLDLKQIIKNKQLSTLIASMLMASYQKRLGDRLGVQPGSELLAGVVNAQKKSVPFSFCDREVRITLRRAWKSTSFVKKGYLLSTLLASVFDKTEVDEEKLKELRQKDVLTELMDEMGDSFPSLKKVLIDERDIYLAEKIKATPGKKIIAVVGAGHVAGMKKKLREDNSSVMDEITTIPPVSKIWKFFGWSIPLIIIASILGIGVKKGAAVAGANILYWILANGIPSSAGAIIALAHPLTIIGAFAAAPVTSLTPVIGAGYVAAFIQVMACPPVVKEFEEVSEDIARVTRWWKNKLLRVFLVFFLTGIGSAIGTYVGGYEIIKNLFS